MILRRIIIGEMLGTLVLVFFGCGSVVAGVILGALPNLVSIAAVFGLAVTFGIAVSRSISGAHLNPAVSFAFALTGHTQWKHLPWYIGSQFLAAFLAAAGLYLIFGPAIADFEIQHAIVRGTPESIQSAMVFGEFYPNPGFADQLQAGTGLAFAVETLGTFVLMLTIYQLAFKPANNPFSFPLAIGLLVFVLICLLAPFTQGGFNPARDLGPRLFSAIAGWGTASFPHGFGEILVYVLGPVLGASAAAGLYQTVLKRVDPGM